MEGNTETATLAKLAEQNPVNISGHCEKINTETHERVMALRRNTTKVNDST